MNTKPDKFKPTHKGHLCGPTRKIIFKSHQAATRRGMEILRAFRAYPCVYCGGWHLTHKI